MDQLIYYPKQNRVHISFKKSKRQERKQYLIKKELRKNCILLEIIIFIKNLNLIEYISI